MHISTLPCGYLECDTVCRPLLALAMLHPGLSVSKKAQKDVDRLSRNLAEQ